MFKVLLFFALVHLSIGDLIVQLPTGKIQGREEVNLNKNITFYAFQQIPYAEPPIGELRFMPPQPASKWDGVLDCTANTKICYQVDFTDARENEDCLTLNVYSPVHPDSNQSLPVMFYIHGGGFVNGYVMFEFFGPHFFMEHDVVLVNVFYRLGPLGFLSTNDDVILGNNGLKDQNLALQWVQENIHLFGGDPTKVTIFGESAGSASVAYQILSKKSEGLFRGAIGESGSAISPWAYQRNARDIAYQLAAFIDPNFNQNSTSEDLLSFMQNVSASTLDSASNGFKEGVGSEQMVEGFFYAPVVEPLVESAFITELMYESIATGNINRVSSMFGICSEEGLYHVQSLDNFKDVLQAYEEDPAALVIKDFHINDSSKKELVGNLTRDIYTDGLFIDDLAAGVKYFSDTSFSRSVIRHAQLQSNYTDMYFYQFSYRGKMGRNNMQVEGADWITHGEDSYYLWCIANQSDALTYFPKEDVDTMEKYMTLFTNFAKYLNPTPEKDDLLDNIQWPKMTPDALNYLNLNDTLEIKQNPKEAVYQKWVDLYEKYAVRPLDTY